LFLFALPLAPMLAPYWLFAQLADTSAAKPAPRADANSQLAHQQLLEKARKGGIDVYFVGDSITRRWGATDPPGDNHLGNSVCVG